MQRYFVKPEQIDPPHVRFEGDDQHHILKVMRFTPGQQVIVCDGEGRDYLVELTVVKPGDVSGRILERLEERRELPVRITLAQGLAKGEKMDWIVQKATEMGAAEIIPFTSSRTIPKWDEKKAQQRIGRWEKIAKEAAEQSHRSLIPAISDVVPYPELVKKAEGYDLALIAYEQESESRLTDFLSQVPDNGRILILIGPEGGFSEEEVELARRNGIRSISLGKRILRTETAGIAVLAFCVYHYEICPK